jgi:hypothetical protein
MSAHTTSLSPNIVAIAAKATTPIHGLKNSDRG